MQPACHEGLQPWPLPGAYRWPRHLHAPKMLIRLPFFLSCCHFSSLRLPHLLPLLTTSWANRETIPPKQGWEMESRDPGSNSCPMCAVFLTVSCMPKLTSPSLSLSPASVPPLVMASVKFSPHPCPVGYMMQHNVSGVEMRVWSLENVVRVVSGPSLRGSWAGQIQIQSLPLVSLVTSLNFSLFIEKIIRMITPTSQKCYENG